MGESKDTHEPRLLLPTILTFAFLPLGIADMIMWLTAQAAWGCEYAVGTGEPCDGPYRVRNARIHLTPVLFVLSYVPVIRLFWTESIRETRRRVVEKTGLVLAAAALQVGPTAWLWWGTPHV